MSKSRKRGAIFALVCILISILWGGRSGLVAERRQAEDVFFSGADGDGLGIRNDLDARIAESYNLVTIARMHMDQNDPKIAAIVNARDVLINSSTPSAMYSANLALTESIEDLYAVYRESGAKGAERRMAEAVYTNLISSNLKIKNDPYNNYARKYNELLSEFPASLLSKLTGVKPLEYFLAAN